MRVYKQEAADGLKDILKDPSHGCLTIASPIEIISGDTPEIQRSFAGLQSLGTNLNQQDLFYLRTILVSTGCNLNDDIFLPDETWEARNTAEDKPFNLSHDPNKIIGHITGNWAVTSDYTILEEEEEIPDFFHLLTSAVIYKHVQSRDPDLTESIAEILEGIKNNEWFVSMECLFTNFDYGFMGSDGSIQEVVSRNKNTAYHTKHLKIYGGTGEYNGRRMGRVLRNITFSGKGLVKKPANPQSIIFNSSSEFGVNTIQREKYNMPNENIEKKNEELLQQVADLQKQIKDADVAATQAKIEELTSTMQTQSEQIADLTAKLDAVSSEASQYKTQAESLATEIKTAKAELAAKTEELSQIQANILNTNRVAMLVDVGVDKSEAEKIVEKFVNLNDEQFSEIAAMQKEMKKENGKCKDEKKDEAAADEVVPNPDVIEDAVAEVEPNLTTPAEDGRVALQSALAEYFTSKKNSK